VPNDLGLVDPLGMEVDGLMYVAPQANPTRLGAT
jgi:hypothetical protein